MDLTDNAGGVYGLDDGLLGTSYGLLLDPPTRSNGGWGTRQRAAKEGGAQLAALADLLVSLLAVAAAVAAAVVAALRWIRAGGEEEGSSAVGVAAGGGLLPGCRCRSGGAAKEGRGAPAWLCAEEMAALVAAAAAAAAARLLDARATDSSKGGGPGCYRSGKSAPDQGG